MSAGSRPSVDVPPPRPERAGLRAWARNSPWLMIAALLHVLVITALSVIVFQSRRVEVEGPIGAAVVARARVELPPEVEVREPILPRNEVPRVPLPDASVVEPVELPLPDAAPGRAGEVSDERDLLLEPGHYNPDPAALEDLPSGATGGTPIGVGRVGHHGTGTSPFSSRVPGGGGKGGGGPGDGGGNGPGDGPPIVTVFSALEWLKKHQSPDGHWDCDGFAAQCRSEPCTGAGGAAHDVGVTGLALLAFLGAGHTHVDGSYTHTVREGLRWLRDAQDEEGCFGERIGQGFLYDHACAALAMTEAYGMTRAKPWREPAQRAIRFVLRAQNPYSAWRYAVPADGDNDTSVTGWMVMALKSAKMSGLTIDDQALENALAWIDDMTDEASGRTGYTDRGGMPSRLAALAAQFPPESSESMTAVGVLARIFGGRTRERDPLIDRGAALLAARLPVWSSETGDVDFYYWYYGTLAMYQVGGRGWEKWNEAIKTAIVDHQRVDQEECEWGSWDPIDPWSSIGGRVYATAVNCLSMEVYYRYPRVFGTRK